MKPETVLRKKIIDSIHKRWPEAYILHTHGNPFTHAGIPDLIIILKGKFFALEIKMPGKKATQLQLHVGRRIQKAEGYWFVVKSVGEAIEVIENAPAIGYDTEWEGS